MSRQRTGQKTDYIVARMNPELHDYIAKEAERRGMNLSEYVRYVLTRYVFDYAPNCDKQPEGENERANLS